MILSSSCFWHVWKPFFYIYHCLSLFWPKLYHLLITLLSILTSVYWPTQSLIIRLGRWKGKRNSGWVICTLVKRRVAVCRLDQSTNRLSAISTKKTLFFFLFLKMIEKFGKVCLFFRSDCAHTLALQMG